MTNNSLHEDGLKSLEKRIIACINNLPTTDDYQPHVIQELLRDLHSALKVAQRRIGKSIELCQWVLDNTPIGKMCYDTTEEIMEALTNSTPGKDDV